MNHADGGPKWADFVAIDLVRHVDATFRTRRGAERRAIGGLSMGGHGALQLALNHPDTFSVAGAHSPTLRPFETSPEFFGDRAGSRRTIRSSLVAHDAAAPRIATWIDVGHEDKWRPSAEVLRSALEAKHAPVEFRMLEGEHEGWYWKHYLPEYLGFYSDALSGGAPPIASLDRPAALQPPLDAGGDAEAGRRGAIRQSVSERSPGSPAPVSGAAGRSAVWVGCRPGSWCPARIRRTRAAPPPPPARPAGPAPARRLPVARVGGDAEVLPPLERRRVAPRRPGSACPAPPPRSRSPAPPARAQVLLDRPQAVDPVVEQLGGQHGHAGPGQHQLERVRRPVHAAAAGQVARHPAVTGGRSSAGAGAAPPGC